MLYAVAHFGAKLMVFLMLPLYTHYFSPSEYGLWDLVITTSTLIAPFITFELVAAVYRWLIEEENVENQKSIITTGAITILRNLLFFNVLVTVLLFFIAIPYGWIALIYINVDIIVSFIQQCARGLGHNKLFASIGLIQTALSVTLILGFIFILQLRLEAFFYAAIIAGTCVIIFAWRTMNFGQYISHQAYSKKKIHSFLTYSLPIIPGAVSWWIMTMSDRYFITIYLGMEYNGIYAIANKIPAFLLMINSVFALAWKDSAILSFKDENRHSYYSTVFHHFFRMMTTTVIMLALLAKPIIALFISDAFYNAWQYIGPLLLATLFNAFSLFWAAGYHGAKKTNIIFITSMTGGMINVLVNFLFIQTLGLYAVVLSTFVAFLTVWVIRVIAAKSYFQIKLKYKDLIVLFPLTMIAIIIPFYVNTTNLIISICFGLIIFIVYNRDMIGYLFHITRGFVRKLKRLAVE